MSVTLARTTAEVTVARAAGAVTVARATGGVTLDVSGSVTVTPGRVRYLSTFDGADPTGATDCADVVTAAIATCAAAGQVLIIDGTYLCSDVVTLVSDAHVFGFGEGISVLRFDWSTQTPASSYLYGTGLDNVTLSGFHILGDGDGTPWGSTAQSGAVVAGIRLIDSTHLLIDAPVLRNVPGLNVILNACRDVRAVGVEIYGAGRDGIHITQQGTTVSERVSVQSCLIDTVGDDAIAVNAGTSANGTAVTVATTAGSATVTGSGTSWVAGDVGKRIAIEGADSGAMLEAVITARASATSITIDRPAPTTVAAASASYGHVRSTGIAIVGNTIRGQAAAGDPLASGRGIYVAGADAPLIMGNSIRDTHGTGIEFDDDENVPLVYCRNPVVVGNSIVGAGTMWGGVNPAGRHGLRVYAVLGGVFTGNVIRGAYAHGIAAARFSDTLIGGNDVDECGSEAGDCGIYVDGVSGERRAQRNKISGNNVRRSWGAGIRINYANRMQVLDNTCSDNGRNGALGDEDCGIVVRGDGTWQINGNHCFDTRPTAQRTQRLGILIGNDGGSPKLHMHDNVCVDNAASPGIAVNNTTAQVWQSGNHSSATDASASPEQWDAVKLVRGTGSPEGAVTAGVGSMYLRTDGGAGSSLYVKESGTGSTGWVAK